MITNESSLFTCNKLNDSIVNSKGRFIKKTDTCKKSLYLSIQNKHVLKLQTSYAATQRRQTHQSP